jgi:hypothetical protein
MYSRAEAVGTGGHGGFHGMGANQRCHAITGCGKMSNLSKWW